jgi:GH15 family glucan-1,4-alpha-glucosidase
MRQNGYARIEDYAAIGDGRTAALVARDGAVDWLCLPNFDSPSVCAAILDPERGGTFELCPADPFEATRRYVPRTNVLETTFTTATGSVRVLDAMTVSDHGLEPLRELARAIEGQSGRVRMRWRFTPRFEYGAGMPRCGWRNGIPVATCGQKAVALATWDAGQPGWEGASIAGAFEVAEGRRAICSLAAADSEPLVLPGREAVEQRMADTIAFWQSWTERRGYDGRWREAVLRSALVLKMMIFAPSGASVAAVTSSLPEEIGGERNWDYRFCWIRDSHFAIDALLALDCHEEAKCLFWWFIQATALTAPRLNPLYRLDGGARLIERDLDLAGYRQSRPVRVGNAAAAQTQLDIYGHLFETAWLYSAGHRALDRDMGAILANMANFVCDNWRTPDSGIWEVRNGTFHFTHSKVMCWVALDRAARLAARGELPAGDAGRWSREAAAIQQFIETECWSPELGSYTRSAGDRRVDASLLMMPIIGYAKSDHADNGRMHGTIDTIMRDLREGDFVYRYRAEDGLSGDEGCFVNCSFWLVSALARVGRVDEATALMERLTARANDVGLYAEEIDPRTGEFLGNFPQALVHLALIDAAIALDRAAGYGERSQRRR